MNNNNLSLGTRIILALDPFVASGEISRETISEFAASFDKPKKTVTKQAKRTATPEPDDKQGTMVDNLLKMVADSNEPISLKNLLDGIGTKGFTNRRSAISTIQMLTENGRLRRVSRGIYTIGNPPAEAPVEVPVVNAN